MKRFIAGLGSALAYFTTLPVGGFARGLAPDAYALSFLPLVGALIGILAGSLGIATARVAPSLVPIVVLAAIWLLSGAIHVDGYLDCCDALFASVTPARRLEILKDPRHGTFAVVGMALLTLLWWSVLRLAGPHTSWIFILAVTGAMSRLVSVCNAWAFRYAPGGTVTDASSARPNVAIVLTCAIALECVVWWMFGPMALAILPVALVLSLGFGRYAARRFGGGITGDAYGFVVAAIEPLLLCALLGFRPFVP